MGVFTPPAYPLDPAGGGLHCDPRDSACVARQNDLSNAYDLALSQAQANNNLDQCHANAQNANSPEQYAAVMAACSGQFAIQDSPDPVAALAVALRTPAAAPTYTAPVQPSVAVRGGQLSFTTSRGGASLQVGDTWTVSITGASPNAPVTVSGSMPGSTFSGSAMGSTDGSGNFSKSGALDFSTVGAWQESWAVGGAPSGSFSFSVAPQVTPAGNVVINSSGPPAGSTATPAQSVSLPTVAGFDLSTIPWWGWLAAGGAALFMMKGGR
jgi:hypothetical protein